MMVRYIVLWLVACFLGVGAYAAKVDPEALWDDDVEEKAMQIISPDFPAGGEIPDKFSCRGENVSPKLVIKHVPREARSLVLIVDDPDAPTPKPWVHWVVANLPGKDQVLDMGIQPQPKKKKKKRRTSRSGKDMPEMPEDIAKMKVPLFPRGVEIGMNSFWRKRYDGPCPPERAKHHYYFRLYALDRRLRGLPFRFSRKDIDSDMSGKVIAGAVLSGTFLQGQPLDPEEED